MCSTTKAYGSMGLAAVGQPTTRNAQYSKLAVVMAGTTRFHGRSGKIMVVSTLASSGSDANVMPASWKPLYTDVPAPACAVDGWRSEDAWQM